MVRTYRVRYSMRATGRQQAPADVVSLDVETELDQLLDHLPPTAYVMYVEDLVANQLVHWTRWPQAFRPGFGG